MFWAMNEAPTTLDPNIPVDAEKLGRLRLILENVAGMLRGDANGTLISRWDADPQIGQQGPTYTDSIVNSERSGRDQRWYLEIPGDVEFGTFTIQVVVPNSTYIGNAVIQNVTVAIPQTQQFQQFNPTAVAAQIETALEAALGVNWPKGINNGQIVRGSVDVRWVYQDEVLGRVGTPWEVPVDPTAYHPPVPAVDPLGNTYIDHGNVLYEVRFQGELHDVQVLMGFVNPTTTSHWVQPPNPPGNQGQPPAPAVQGGGPVFLFPGDTQGFEGTQQYNTGIGMTPAGDLVSVYTQLELTTDTPTTLTGDPLFNDDGVPVSQNIMYRQLDESSDTAGPRLVNWTDSSGKAVTANIPVLAANSQYMILTFDEEMMAGDPAQNPDSVLNPKNYRFYDAAGNELIGTVVNVQYGLSEVAQLAGLGLNPIPSNKWEVVLTLDGDTRTPGIQPLADGSYTMQVVHAIQSSSTTAGQAGLRDRAGNPMYSTGFTPGGADYTRTFRVSSTLGPPPPGSPGINDVDVSINATHVLNQFDPTVATDAAGNYVVVWTIFGQPGDTLQQGNILAQRFDPTGQKLGPEFVVNTSLPGTQIQPDVAMDDNGNFVVVWSGSGPYTYTDGVGNTSDVYMRRFDSTGAAQSLQIQVNQFRGSIQDQPHVAMSASGAGFVVTWTSFGNPGTNQAGIYARRFAANGQALTNEFGVSTNMTDRQEKSDVAMDNAGDYVVVWQNDHATAAAEDISGRYYFANGTASSEFSVNVNTTAQQVDPRVGMDSAGNFVATWAGLQNVNNGYDIYARRFAAGGAPRAGEFLVNQTVANWQITPDVGVAKNGDFTIVWSTFDQDNRAVGNVTLHDYGIYARMYLASGADFADPKKGVLGEWRVNATAQGNQVTPVVDRRTNAGDAVIAWVGPDFSSPAGSTGIYARLVDPPAVKAARHDSRAGGPEACDAHASEARRARKPLRSLSPRSLRSPWPRSLWSPRRSEACGPEACGPRSLRSRSRPWLRSPSRRSLRSRSRPWPRSP